MTFGKVRRLNGPLYLLLYIATDWLDPIDKSEGMTPLREGG